MSIDLNQYEVGPIKKKRHSLAGRTSIFWHCLMTSLAGAPSTHRLERFDKSIRLDIDTTLTGEDVILVACDKVYFFNYAVPFLRSLAAVEGTFFVHMHLLDPDADVEEKLRQLRTELGNTHLSFGIDTLFGLKLPTRLNIYYNCSRFIAADRLLELGVGRLLILDVDTIMRSSPWKKFDGFKAEGAFVFREHAKKPWYKILANTVYLQNSANIRAFTRRFSTALLAVLATNPTYHIDQIIPYYLLKIGRRRFASVFAPVPADVMSLSYDPAASFWTAKGGGKHADKFQSEIRSINKAHRTSADDPLEEA